ncbi:hypothetical protein NDU88_002996 [Pleurodeles waltl]|uniref:Uncharacterized protein n=1 Tax=Pleurodeles waltl TaxID=8319 RepID=A0AAV7MPA2_PLEWA|nr:hypothetical protein NDU88_002996 [Pleurodeles waltl]
MLGAGVALWETRTDAHLGGGYTWGWSGGLGIWGPTLELCPGAAGVLPGGANNYRVEPDFSDAILRETSARFYFRCRDDKVLLFPDYINEVLQQRRSAMDIKQELRALGLQYHLIYPVRLRVIHANKTHFFDTMASALSWMKEECTTTQQGSPQGPHLTDMGRSI